MENASQFIIEAKEINFVNCHTFTDNKCHVVVNPQKYDIIVDAGYLIIDGITVKEKPYNTIGPNGEHYYIKIFVDNHKPFKYQHNYKMTRRCTEYGVIINEISLLNGERTIIHNRFTSEFLPHKLKDNNSLLTE